MTEKQAEKMIKLLEDISSKLDTISTHTMEITNLSSETLALERIIELLKYRD